eukprot:TRINITY_DN38373_c0_g1_i4.p1 TRINITY_DN38373_c0_g1~~TRINITY_DN38373_c0_g1_i4.p1  ORF type:complete len:199 (-),score=37.78 TRINITY_DN38373_c0_g1_i4:43-639(-)
MRHVVLVLRVLTERVKQRTCNEKVTAGELDTADDVTATEHCRLIVGLGTGDAHFVEAGGEEDCDSDSSDDEPPPGGVADPEPDVSTPVVDPLPDAAGFVASPRPLPKSVSLIIVPGSDCVSPHYVAELPVGEKFAENGKRIMSLSFMPEGGPIKGGTRRTREAALAQIEAAVFKWESSKAEPSSVPASSSSAKRIRTD